MKPDTAPIIFNTPEENEAIEVYFAHDIHYGSEATDIKRWDRLKRHILAEPTRYLILVGDYMDTALAGSKSDFYAAKESIQSQQIWLQGELSDLKEHILCVVPGNHENRFMKSVGLDMVYEACVIAGIPDKYRQRCAFVDIGVGSGGHGKGKQVRYVGFVTHKAKDMKNFSTADVVENVDFAAFGHDHAPSDKPRSRVGYDAKNKSVYHRDVEVIDSGSFLNWFGSYGSSDGYRPQSTKLYKLVLDGKKKQIVTVGYHI